MFNKCPLTFDRISGSTFSWIEKNGILKVIGEKRVIADLREKKMVGFEKGGKKS